MRKVNLRLKKSQKRNRQETSEIFLTDKDRKIQKSENDFVHDTVCIKFSIGIAEKKGHGNSCTSWHGSQKCVFCHQNESIKHLFFQCRFARFIWSVIQVASTLFPPRSITNIFGNWLNGIDNRFKKAY
jgi:hypothetical protein